MVVYRTSFEALFFGGSLTLPDALTNAEAQVKSSSVKVTTTTRLKRSDDDDETLTPWA